MSGGEAEDLLAGAAALGGGFRLAAIFYELMELIALALRFDEGGADGIQDLLEVLL